MTTQHKYHEMARDLIVELTAVWGQEKWQDWWNENIVPLRHKVNLTYKDLYRILKDEHDELQQLKDVIFRNQYIDLMAQIYDRREQMMEEEELRHGG
jgi:chemotaxis regulatin CheY-phosphate phosphatase CheZ